jgi:uncharacterized cysteine cluster protein YcgN (CxxCxxCC family)
VTTEKISDDKFMNKRILEIIKKDFSEKVCEQTGECLEHKKMLILQINEAVKA